MADPAIPAAVPSSRPKCGRCSGPRRLRLSRCYPSISTPVIQGFPFLRHAILDRAYGRPVQSIDANINDDPVRYIVELPEKSATTEEWLEGIRREVVRRCEAEQHALLRWQATVAMGGTFSPPPVVEVRAGRAAVLRDLEVLTPRCWITTIHDSATSGGFSTHYAQPTRSNADLDGALAARLRQLPKSATTEEWLEDIRREDAGRALVTGVAVADDEQTH